jgi:hypothetical protein
MARTVTVVLSSATSKVGQRVPGRVNVASTDTDPIQVTGVVIYPTKVHSSLSVTQPELGAGGGAGLGGARATRQTVVNNGASISLPFDVVGHHPQVPGATAIAYEMTAVVTFSDGVTGSGTATLTVSPLA